MKDIICKKGKKCVFLKEEKVRYKYESRGFIHSGVQLQYRCMNRKRFKQYQNNILTHKQRYSECGFKTTDLLETFT